MIDAASIAQVRGGRSTGNGNHLCQCPVPTHGRGRGDRNPSLSISDGDDGKLLVHCHAGCDPRDVLSALAYYDEGDRQSRTNGERFFRGAKSNGAQPDSEPKRFFDGHLIQDGYTFVCAYDYTTEDGERLYQVCRYEGPDKRKEFLQRRPDRQGAWFSGAGTRKVLYRWPDLKKVAHDTVFVCEGEKDADRLASLGFAAVTVASGSWSEEAIRALAGYHCFILEDNDKPGRDKAQKAAAALHGVAASVRIVRLHGLGDGEDVSDWLDAGGDTSKLVDIAKAAPLWEPESSEGQSHEEAEAEAEKLSIAATPFIWLDAAKIRRRQFLYGTHLSRQFVSTTVAPGGVGKSSLGIVENLAMASGKPLLGVEPAGRLRVWLWNGEDPMEELERRVMAAAQHYGLTREDLEGYLFLDSGRRMPVVIAEQTRSGTVIAAPVVEAVIKTITENRIDVMSVDPFVASHRVTENDNNAVERVAKTWAGIADVTHAAIDLVHHTRKTNGMEATVEDGRGASALLSAARSARVLNGMSPEEAEKAGLEVEERRFYFRTDNGKANLAPPEATAWFHLASVDLANGDKVGVVETWKWPDPFDNVTVKDLRAAQQAVAAGGPWRENSRAQNWVGKPIAKALGLNPENKSDAKKVAGLLKVWLANGMFVRVMVRDPERREEKPCIEVGQWATD